MHDTFRRLLPSWPLWALLLMLAVAASAGPRDPLYVWTDEAGVTRYTTHLERVPPGQREAATPVREDDDAPLLARIAVLENRIEADQATVSDWLSAESSDAQRDALKEVAERLPRLQAELQTLRARVRPAARAESP